MSLILFDSTFRTLQSMFTWFFWTINFGSLASTISTNVERYYSYWLAFLLPMTVFIGSIIVLIVGRHRYIRAPPGGSMMVRAGRVVFTAVRMRWRLGQPAAGESFLDLAKQKLLPSQGDNESEMTILEQNQFINDLKQACRACRVFAFYPFFWVCNIQLGGNMISQAAQMNVGSFQLSISGDIRFHALISRSVSQRCIAEY